MTKRTVRPSMLGALTVGTAALAFATLTMAQTPDLDIPEGDLAAALEAYIAASGQQVLYRVDDVKGRRSKGVRGALPPEEALRQLIAGTQLSVKRDASGAIVLFTEAAAASAAKNEGGEGEEATLTKVLITGKGISHLGERNRTGTRTDTDPMDLAQSVTTVKRQLIEEQQASDLRQILTNVAGVSATPGMNASGFSARGLEASVTRNGAIAEGSSTRSNLPSFAIESVEVVRGAESVVGGQAAGYGGLINVVTKAANGKRVREVQTRLGSRGLRAVGVDVGDVLPDEPEVSARLVAESERNGDTMAGYAGARSDYVSASTAWEHKASGTTVLGDLSWHRNRDPFPALVYAKTMVDNGLTPARFPGHEAGNLFEETGGALTVNQVLGKGWSARLRVEHIVFDTSGLYLATMADPSETYPLIHITRSEASKNRNVTDTQRAELMGTLAWGDLSNQLLVGVDNNRNRVTAFSFTDLSSFAYDLRDGTWTDTSADNGLPAPPFMIDGDTRSERGLILQDQWYLGDDWAGLLAARYIDVDSFGSTFQKWLPSVGLVYHVTPKLSVYGNSTRSFLSNAGKLTIAQARLPDETAHSRELGAKAILDDGNLALTGAVYEIRRNNAAVPDFDNDPSGQFYRVDPVLYSRGVELEASGSAGNHLSWRFGGATNRMTNAAGERQTGYPLQQLSAYLRYNFSGDDKGWWSSMLLSRQTSSEKGRDPRHQVDLDAGYIGDDWSISASLKSAAARRLLDGNGTSSAMVDQERFFSVMATVKF